MCRPPPAPPALPARNPAAEKVGQQKTPPLQRRIPPKPPRLSLPTRPRLARGRVRLPVASAASTKCKKKKKKRKDKRIRPTRGAVAPRCAVKSRRPGPLRVCPAPFLTPYAAARTCCAYRTHSAALSAARRYRVFGSAAFPSLAPPGGTPAWPRLCVPLLPSAGRCQKMVVFRCALDDSDESCSADEGSPPPVRKTAPFVIRRLNRSGFGPIERPRATPMRPPWVAPGVVPARARSPLKNKKDSPANNTRVKRGYGVPEYDSDLSDESDTDEQRARPSVTLCDQFLSTNKTTSVSAARTALFSSSRGPPSVSPAKKVTLNPLGEVKTPLSLPKRYLLVELPQIDTRLPGEFRMVQLCSDVTLSKLLEGLEFSSDVSRSKRRNLLLSEVPHCAPKSRSMSRRCVGTILLFNFGKVEFATPDAAPIQFEVPATPDQKAQKKMPLP
ncbi:MAG: hypothetical protein BJ554DRAFT_4946 [Olpidium bornovanus]|uniref:Uncharacterized protein n=1 Tax=Olpidium bornovanus TaxID=278681 RepID=A0A8H7ZZX8_9FUNG|nr:MAG: hypothetical protein BJ554DRAFT_4946 [Olpidium bornovanus]